MRGSLPQLKYGTRDVKPVRGSLACLGSASGSERGRATPSRNVRRHGHGVDPVSGDIRVTCNWDGIQPGVSPVGYGNAAAGWPVSSDPISRQDNPANLISTSPTSHGDLIPRLRYGNAENDSVSLCPDVLALEIHFRRRTRDVEIAIPRSYPRKRIRDTSSPAVSSCSRRPGVRNGWEEWVPRFVRAIKHEHNPTRSMRTSFASARAFPFSVTPRTSFPLRAFFSFVRVLISPCSG